LSLLGKVILIHSVFNKERRTANIGCK